MVHLTQTNGQTPQVLRNSLNTREVKCQKMGLCSQHLSSLIISMTCSQSEPFAFSSLLELLIVCLKYNPFDPLFSFWRSLAMAWPLLSHMGLAWHLSVISSSPIQHEICCLDLIIANSSQYLLIQLEPVMGKRLFLFHFFYQVKTGGDHVRVQRESIRPS